MRRPKSRKPVEWRQLCAIAKGVITADPTIDDFEWKERIKDRIIALDLTYPERLDAINAAMSAVEKALEKKHGGPRPTPPPATTPPHQGAMVSPPPLTHDESLRALARVSAFCKQPSPTSASSS